ncbi:asparagine synthase (glutamine-hydrolyzing) [candidate division KSB3 bacterium]|uniref:asparagine synthase (glutamine-hydrolyzing) n=1 Tax=candidate division KSB3 bacterium TaxID=2044937 RepID=A0A2G6K8F2_9BACT|nr:MAG: asparagine synthase (glutamine-hydrolyzing) [candidate division KSB3 bacterium]
MCGICGFAGFRNDGLLPEMMSLLAHRGPDDEGTLLDHTHHVYLGHRRLSIIDLSTGHQPLYNEDGSIAVIFNGEIYNYLDLRKSLEHEGHTFTTHSDTEVLVHLYEEYGTDMPDRLNGIFAFVIYDRRHRRIFGARDHFGVKPLFYWQKKDQFLFASEVKALLAYKHIPGEINFEALHYALNLRFIPCELTLFQEIYRLSAGTYFTFDVASARFSTTVYRDVHYAVDYNMSKENAIEGIRHYLQQAVQRQLISDVPIGAYLSGGLDSSSIVAYASEKMPDIQTFSMGFDEPTDEVEDARMIATHFQTPFHETFIQINPLESLREAVWHVEEPKINMLQGYFLAKFTRQHVKVALSGLGGDELFAGYVNNQFLYPLQILHRMIPPNPISRFLSHAVFMGGNRLGNLKFDEYRRGLQMLFSYGDKTKFYAILRNVWDYDDEFYTNVYSAELKHEMLPYRTDTLFERFFEQRHQSIVEQSLRAEFHTKLVEDFLLNEDRTSMAHSLEIRVPFLDKDLVKFAFSIPYTLKIQRNITKYIYKEAMRGVLPDYTRTKKKWGFAINPYYQFKKDLKSVALEMLNEKRIREQGIFNYRYIHKILHHEISPRLRWHYYYIWQLVGFQHWYDLFIQNSP